MIQTKDLEVVAEDLYEDRYSLASSLQKGEVVNRLSSERNLGSSIKSLPMKRQEFIA